MYRNWKAEVVIIQEGLEPLPICNNCGMHMLVVRLTKQRRTAICEKATEIRLRSRNVEMSERCGEMEFILKGERGTRWWREL